MSTAQIEWTNRAVLHATEGVLEEPHWYAIQTRCRFEKKVASQLQDKGIEIFLPLVKQVHRWSDRRQVIEVPLFPGYGFVHLYLDPKTRLQVVQTCGVVGFVGCNGEASPIPRKQIEDIQLLLSNEISCKAYPFLKVGQRVRVHGGCLDGLEGILIVENKDHSLAISIESIQRSICLRVEGFDVEAV